jgi:hypothetical protein
MRTSIAKTRTLILLIAMGGLVMCGGCRDKMSEGIEDKSAGLNGDFEIVKSGLPVNWLLYTKNTVPHGDFDLVIDDHEFKSGNQSLKFVVRECSDTGGWHSPGFTRELPADPGATYQISFWARNEGSKFHFIAGGVSAFEGNDGVDVQSSESIEEWTKMEYKFRVPAKYERIRFQLNILEPGTFWIDDLQVKKISDETD